MKSFFPNAGGQCAGPGETIHLGLGLEPMWLGLKPSQNPAWDLNPRGWDSNPAKKHGTWFQDLMKLRFLMSHHRKNSSRDRSEVDLLRLRGSTPHRQCRPSQRVSVALRCGGVSFYRLSNFIC